MGQAVIERTGFQGADAKILPADQPGALVQSPVALPRSDLSLSESESTLPVHSTIASFFSWRLFRNCNTSCHIFYLLPWEFIGTMIKSFPSHSIRIKDKQIRCLSNPRFYC
jgi:hypothetical protein